MQLPQGVSALSLAELMREIGEGAALRTLYSCYAEVRLDVPRSGAATEMAFETYIKRLSGKHFYPAGVWLARTAEGKIVALSELWRAEDNPKRLDIGLTGTRRAWRRQGLALALKLRGMQCAQAQEVQELWTGNAATNAPMLALNRRLGFRPRSAYIEFKWGHVADQTDPSRN